MLKSATQCTIEAYYDFIHERYSKLPSAESYDKQQFDYAMVRTPTLMPRDISTFPRESGTVYHVRFHKIKWQLDNGQTVRLWVNRAVFREFEAHMNCRANVAKLMLADLPTLLG